MSELKCMQEPTEEDYRDNIRVSRDGRSIDCKKGLWSVTSSMLEQNHVKARWYFYQYWKEGEYTGEQLEVLKKLDF